jgi:hypothetical protein
MENTGRFKDIGMLILASFLGAFASKILDIFMNNSIPSWIRYYFIFWFVGYSVFAYFLFNIREFSKEKKWHIVIFLVLLSIFVISPVLLF